MTLLRSTVWCGALAVAISGCNFDLHSIPSIEDCMEAGVGNCGSSGNGGSGGVSGSGGVGGGNGGCTLSQFNCNDGTANNCIPLSDRCNGIDDCRDGDDEDPAMCSGTCNLGEFRCNDATCIPLSSRCDGIPDCVGGEDEDGVICGGNSCGALQFECANASCILNTRVCDGTPHCSDASDEDPAMCQLQCGPCPAINPSLGTACCVDSNTCGVQGTGTGICIDAFDPGPLDANCPAETLVGANAAGCCRTDGRCGVQGNILNLGCVAREDIPPAFGGPYPFQSCGGSIDRIECLSNNECAPFGQVCGDLDYNTGAFHCVPLMGGGETGDQCFDPMASGECASGLCFPNTLECTTACSSVFDCDSALQVCAGFLAVNGTQFSVCSTLCGSQRYCRTDQTCAIGIDAQTGDANGMCAALDQQGTLRSNFGEPCGMDVECASNLCVSSIFGMRRCSAVCQMSPDCQGLFPQCASIQQLGRSGTISVCQ